ncbi:MAG: RnfH family protein [Pseudomonadota bacterium]
MSVPVIYAGSEQIILKQRVKNDTTVGEVIHLSGILDMCSDIDLSVNKIGIYGKLVKLDSRLKAGDRIEIYRKITRVIDEEDDDDDDF